MCAWPRELVNSLRARERSAYSLRIISNETCSRARDSRISARSVALTAFAERLRANGCLDGFTAVIQSARVSRTLNEIKRSYRWPMSDHRVRSLGYRVSENRFQRERVFTELKIGDFLSGGSDHGARKTRMCLGKRIPREQFYLP